eukprot:637407_1
MGNKPPGSEGFEMPQPLGAQPNQNNLPYQQQQLPQSDHDQAPIIQQTTSAEIATNPNMAQLDQYPNNNGQNMNPYAANNNMNPYSPQQQQYQPNHHQQPPHNYQQQQPQQQPMQQQQQPQQQQQQHAMNTNYNNMGPGAPDVSNQPNEEMQAVGGRCTQVSCRCKAFTESQSKWSKGKCKTCDHAPSTHKTQWVKPGCDPTSPKSPYSPYVKPTTPAKSMKPEPDTMENVWGQEFTDALKECVAKTFEYDAESILAAKYLLHFLKKRVGFSFAGQSQHRNALQYAFVELLGWRVVNQWGFNVRVIYEDDMD